MGQRKDFITLYELNSEIRDTLEAEMDAPIWVQAELSDVRTNRGHCYLEFVQKAPDGDSLLAKCRGMIWASNWTLLKPYFEKETGQRFADGLQVLVQVEVTFHELYGLSLNVLDIDPTYTIGDIARRRQEILRKLEEQGIIDMNKQLEMPLLLQNIAVISSETAAGWGDFHDQIINNIYGLAFNIKLFPAVMQGEKIEETVIDALDQIASEEDKWDVVVIIRGGGATSDLSGFDNLHLAECVAQFPLPIITGIGHERDDTVIDMIANQRVKTPTAAAELIISHQLEQVQKMASIAERLTRGTSNYLIREKNKLERIQVTTSLLASQHLQKCRHKLELFEMKINDASPERLLKLGFSVARINGKAIKDSSQLKKGDKIEITFAKGKATTEVKDYE